MKNYLLVLSLIVVFQSEAQNTFPFPDTNAYWNMFSFNWGNMYVENPIGVVGDTTINNTQYVKICQSTDTLFEFQADYPFYCAVREEDSKYYFVFPNETSEILYYDFTLEVGDTIEYPQYSYIWLPLALKVVGKDSVLVGANYRKRLSLINLDTITTGSSPNQIWIEGIGSLFGLRHIQNYTIDGYHATSCFHQNDTLVYLNPQFQACYRWTLVGLEENQIQPLKVFPNPATEQISFEVLSDELVNSQFEIVDIKGEIFYNSIINSPSFSVSINNLSPGVYFYDITHSSERVYRGKFVKQ
jgi:hypothetical protein